MSATASVRVEGAVRTVSTDAVLLAEPSAYSPAQEAALRGLLTKAEPESKTTETRAEAEIAVRGTTLERQLVVPQRASASLLAEWNGCVLAIEPHQFSATLKGVFGEGVQGEEEDAEIPVSDVSEFDMEWLRPGNFFRLCVFYEIREDGQPRRYTQVIFRRLPAYRAVDLAKAEERAAEIQRALRVE